MTSADLTTLRTQLGEIPSQNGHGPRELDRSYFVDDELLEKEFRNVFHPSWLFLGHESEVPTPGDYVTRKMGRDRVILTRTVDGDLNVVLNSCMHRGTTLCKAAVGQARNFRCGYHGWTYRNDGTLLAVPKLNECYGATFDKSRYHLPVARVETFMGLVFATWNHTGPSLSEFLGDIAWYLEAMLSVPAGGYEAAAPPQRYIQSANWKFPEENDGGDGYHLPVAHGAMFDMGLFGSQATEVAGHVLQTPQGHVLRRQYVVQDFGQPAYFGFPPEQWPEITQRLRPEQVSFLKNSSVIHGAVFPNLAFVIAAFPSTGDPGDVETSILTLRVHNPIDAHTAEVIYWLLVGKEWSPELKRASYKTQVRIFSGAAFFEADDYENFMRIDLASRGEMGRAVPFDYTLSADVEAPPSQEPWPGPGNVQSFDVSEENQRAFYRRYLEMMNSDDAPVGGH